MNLRDNLNVPRESQHLLEESRYSIEMGDVSQTDKALVRIETAYTDLTDIAQSSQAPLSGHHSLENDHRPTHEYPTAYRTYKVRWFGLAQLILLNIVVSWNVS